MGTEAPSVADFLAGSGGGKSLKFENLGDVNEGVVVSAEIKQSRDIDGNLEFWDNQDPKWQLQVRLQTELRDGNDDDGMRTFYANGGKQDADTGVGKTGQEAIRAALKDAGLKEIPIGGHMKIRFSGTKTPAKKSFNAGKRFQVKITAPAESTVAAEDF